MNLQEKLQGKVFEALKTAVNESGMESYLIGGFVRDLILERTSKDVDVVCVGSGIKLAEKFLKKTGQQGEIHVYKNFGTALVRVDDWDVEFVGARKESYRKDSRKPVVEDGTLEDDQNRRDFTINALAIGLNEDNFGELKDPFNGLKDIENKAIRTPLDPELTFSDDPLRMMRAIRFAAQLGFDIEPETFEAITRNKHRIEIVSMERITDELHKIIMAPTPSYGFKLLDASAVLDIIFPELTALKGVEIKEGIGHKDNFYHTLKVLDNISKYTEKLWLRWASLLHDIGKPQSKRFHNKKGWTFHGHEDLGARMIPQIFRRMRLPLNEKMRYVQKLVRLSSRPIPLVQENITDSALRRLLYEAGDDIDDLMTLCRADITTKDDRKMKKYLANFDIVESKLKEIEEKDKLRNFQPVITGDIIMKTFDIKPSKAVGQIKEEIKDAILEGIIPNEYQACHDYMLKIAPKYIEKEKIEKVSKQA